MAEETKEAPKVEKKTKEAPKANKEAIEKDVQDYTKFAELHLLMCDEHGFNKKRIKAEAFKTYEKLEKKFSDYKGKKAKKTANVFMGLGNGTRKIVEGYAVPEPIYKEFADAKIAGSWF